MKTFILISIVFLASFSSACPLGKNESHLTVQRVMRNLGRFTLHAESVTLKGINPHDTVQDSELQKAIDDLDIAMSCLQAVIQNPKGDLLPSHSQTFKGQGLEDYIHLYIALMREFKIVLFDFQKMLKAILLTTGQRNFDIPRNHMLVIDEYVTRAHQAMSGF
ncbi:MAG: hypothetical protein AB7O96_19890 [Pseudobdellovibrionaceae bacterium]